MNVRKLESAGDQLAGFCVCPNVAEVNEISAENIPDYWTSYKLWNGCILDIKNETHKQLKCDFNGGDSHWDGYITGFIYPDGKYFGKIHYVPESNLVNENLEGKYNTFENGIEIKGIWYDYQGDKYGFFIRLEKIFVLTIAERVLAKTTSQKRIQKNQRIDTLPDILTKDLHKLVTLNSQRTPQQNRRLIYNLYNHIIGLNLKPNNFEDLILVMSIAYSWMPTMLDIYLPSKRHAKKLLNAVQNLGAVTTLNQFEEQKELIERWLVELVGVVNHSIVGVSKVLHIFYPKIIPMIDSRMLKGWYKTFHSLYKEQPALKLPKNIPQTIKSMVKTYMDYWKLLLCWNYNTGNKDIRKLEEPFYLLGKIK